MSSYRGALVLNHMAIELIKQRSYSHGLATLKDAIALMKATFASQSNSSPLDLEVETKVRLARERLVLSAEQAIFPVPAAHNIRVVDDVLTIETMESYMRQNDDTSLSSPIILVRIDPDSTVNDNCTPCSPDFESAVLLQNMGAAYYCLSQQQSSVLAKFLAVATRLWQMSRDILMKLTKGHEQHCVGLMLPEVLYVASVVMENQIKALHLEVYGDNEQQQQQQQSREEEIIATSRATLGKLRLALRLMLDKLEDMRISSLRLAPAA